MVQSKRAKVVSLTQVKKKDRSRKAELIEKIQDACRRFSHVVVFNAENEKAVHMQYIRSALKPSKIFYGGNKIMIKALKEFSDMDDTLDINTLCNSLFGHRGLIFTDSDISTVSKIFESYTPKEAAKFGFVANETVVLKEGTESLSRFPHSMEPQLRNLGLPTVLKSGVIHLMGDTTVCTKGVPLTVEAAQLLNLLGYRMAEFRISVVVHFGKGNSSHLNPHAEC